MKRPKTSGEVTAPKFLCARCDEALQALDEAAAREPDRRGEVAPPDAEEA